MTLAEKILAAHSGEREVHPGQFTNARVDLGLTSELSGVVAIEEFDKIKGARDLRPAEGRACDGSLHAR